MKIKKETMLTLYRTMKTIRLFEERVGTLIDRGKIVGPAHLYIGEEASATGACANLADGDYITSTHRGHGHSIARGADVKLMFAELMGKVDGYCKGRGGSMHIADVKGGNLGANGIVAGGAPIAVGAAMTIRAKNRDNVVVCFFGDGALNEGVLHESINLAAIWDLPVVFLCENNQYAMSLSNKKAFRIDDLAKRSEAYGIPGERVDGNDVMAVYEAIRTAKAHAIKHGPSFIVTDTYRFRGHGKSDADNYRTREEIESWIKRDPIPRFAKVLVEEKRCSEEEIRAIDEEVANLIDEAERFAIESPVPPIEIALEDVYA